MGPWRAPPKQTLSGSKENTSSVSSPTAGPPAASPEVVVGRASCHQVVDAHGAQLSDAVHPVLSLHQHLQGRGAGWRQVKATRSITNPPQSVTRLGACEPLPANDLTSNKREKQTQHWATQGTQPAAAAVRGSPALGPELGTVDRRQASALPLATTKGTRNTSCLPPWTEKLFSK